MGVWRRKDEGRGLRWSSERVDSGAAREVYHGGYLVLKAKSRIVGNYGVWKAKSKGLAMDG